MKHGESIALGTDMPRDTATIPSYIMDSVPAVSTLPHDGYLEVGKPESFPAPDPSLPS